MILLSADGVIFSSLKGRQYFAISIIVEDLSPLTSPEACEKSIQWLWKESCVSTSVIKPGNRCASPMTLDVKVA